ncbi:MAG: rhodanese-like domain-containing protein [Rhodopseudomonas palustris]|nr:rhodanese-like domain-containing protein [Rhodopseudomonas palustris]
MPSTLRNAAAAVLALAAIGAAADEKPVNITADLPAVEVKHEGKMVRVVRNPDTLNQIDPDFALTSRPCPPYCIQPMQIAPGVETIGELEVLDYLRKMSGGDDGVMVIDSREKEWLLRSGIIPGAVNIPWNDLSMSQADPGAIADILELRFGATRSGSLWNFSTARALVLYCNGAWCGQSPTNIRQLLALGYPAHKLKWYRGGMQSWKALGLTTAEVKASPKQGAPR